MRICKCGHNSEEHKFQPCESEHPCRHFDEKTMKTCECKQFELATEEENAV